MPIASLAILGSILIFTWILPLIYPVDPFALDAEAILMPPSWENPLGTDRLGRDIFSRLIYGGQVSLLIGLGSAIIASLIGLVMGVSAGYFQGKIDGIFVVVVDLFLTFPTFFLLLALTSYMEASSLALILIISLTGWMGTARLLRSQSYEITQKPFIKILRVASVSKIKIIFKYFLPLLAPLFFVSFTFALSGAILAESGLSYLGLGITPPQMSWGSMLSEGKSVMEIAWWVSFFPGLMIFLVTFSLILLSDSLQSITNQKELNR
ncbi:MAG TPA: ABC transporter permease [Epsilonproteobacteria bacterium]|nr:ABC transporter permease [Campylobacterota bacterium]